MPRITPAYIRKGYMQMFAQMSLEMQAAQLEALDSIHLLKRGKRLYEADSATDEEPPLLQTDKEGDREA